MPCAWGSAPNQILPAQQPAGLGVLRWTDAQVIARAHRMGAKQTVHVELLVMAGTAEEELLSMASLPWMGSEDEAAAVAAAEARAGAAGGGHSTGRGEAEGGTEGVPKGQARAGLDVGPVALGKEAGSDGRAGGGPGGARKGARGNKRGGERRGGPRCATDNGHGLGGGAAGREEGGEGGEEGASSSGAGGAGGHRVALEKRGVRNLFFLHLRKVCVCVHMRAGVCPVLTP